MIVRRMALLHKGLLIILLPLLYQVALFGFLLRQQAKHAEVQDLAVHTKEVLQGVTAIQQAVFALQVDLRGRLLGLPPATAGLQPEMEDLTPRSEELAKLVVDNPEQHQRAESLIALSREHLQQVALVRDLATHNRGSEAAALLKAPANAARIAKIHEQINAVRASEVQLDAERLDSLRASTKRLNRLLISGLGLNVLVAVVAMMLLGRAIGRRTAGLTENLERMKRGEALLAPSDASDELGELDRSFHAMATALEAARERAKLFLEMLEARHVELQRANDELQQKNQENEMFVYSVSHDLRSPLVNLQGFSKELGMVRNDLSALFAGPLNEEDRKRGIRLIERDVSESVLYIQTAVMRLSSIIDALLRLSRAGRVEYRPAEVDVEVVVHRIIDAMRDSISQRKAKVTVTSMPHAWGDPTAIEQIFANLVGNAVNYLDKARPGLIEVGSEPPPPGKENRTCYYVRDNGLGIPEAHLPKLFAVFQRLHEKVAPGEGIGLALVRRAVERHGGRIWVESKAGVGTTFFLSFPTQNASPLEYSPPPADSARRDISRVGVAETASMQDTPAA